MAAKITLYNLADSPNNMKARIALNYKELPFEKIPIDPQNRAPIIEISGQPFTPLMVHGEIVVFDSGGILRYLEANFRKTRRLFSSDYQAMHQIERWELYGRKELAEPIGMVFNQFFSPEKNAAELERASSMIHDRTAMIEDRLAQGSWLVGDSMTAADVTCAPCVYYGMLDPKTEESSPIRAFFSRSMKLGEGRDHTRDWALKVMAFDR